MIHVDAYVLAIPTGWIKYVRITATKNGEPACVWFLRGISNRKSINGKCIVLEMDSVIT